MPPRGRVTQTRQSVVFTADKSPVMSCTVERLTRIRIETNTEERMPASHMSYWLPVTFLLNQAWPRQTMTKEYNMSSYCISGILHPQEGRLGSLLVVGSVAPALPV